MLRGMSKTTTTKRPVVIDPSDFSDLGPVTRAPDEPGAASPDAPPPAPEPMPVPVIAPLPSIVLSPHEVVAAIRSGNSTGLPEVIPGHGMAQNGTDLALKVEVVERGDVVANTEVYLGKTAEEVTCAIGGHAVTCTLERRVFISRWSVMGSREALSGKLRLLNDVTIAVAGVGMQQFRKNDEFFPHQVPLDDIKAAGGIVIAL
jgi:hypothetical protein